MFKGLEDCLWLYAGLAYRLHNVQSVLSFMPFPGLQPVKLINIINRKCRIKMNNINPLLIRVRLILSNFKNVKYFLDVRLIVSN